MVRLYRSAPTDTPVPGVPNGVKYSLHMAVAAAADLSVVDELIELAVDRRNATYRSMFVEHLAHMSDPRARAAVEELSNEPSPRWKMSNRSSLNYPGLHRPVFSSRFHVQTALSSSRNGGCLLRLARCSSTHRKIFESV